MFSPLLLSCPLTKMEVASVREHQVLLWQPLVDVNNTPQGYIPCMVLGSPFHSHGCDTCHIEVQQAT